MNRRQARTLITVIMLMVFTVVLVTFLGYLVNRRLVASQRKGCERNAANLVAQVEAFREGVIGNFAIAHDPRQPLVTRRARLKEAVTVQQQVWVLDTHIATDRVASLTLPADRQRALASGFTCAKAYPIPTLPLTP